LAACRRLPDCERSGATNSKQEDVVRTIIGYCSLVVIIAVGAVPTPVAAESAVPDLRGTWTCDTSELLIRDQWTRLTYTIDVVEQRGALMKANFTWTLPNDKGVTGQQGGKSSFSNVSKTLGVIGWDNTSVDFVAYGDVNRRNGKLIDANTMQFVNSEVGNDAWVNRTVCRRKK
jgi:hypothetical protein